jgi:hypothetical protein
MDNPKRARSWKRQIQPRVGLKTVEPVPYSTLKPKLNRDRAAVSKDEKDCNVPYFVPYFYGQSQ